MGGDIIIRNGYFVHFISPENLDPFPKNIIFVIDRSGSMGGQKMERTKEAFEIILEDLKNDEKFNVIAFDNQIDLFAPQAQEAEKKSAAIEFVQGMLET
jgi:inter-alpha-trypsin inhibitor heavy chain H2